MRRVSLATRALAVACTLLASLVVGSTGAQAVVVEMGAAGHTGVALVPGTRANLATAGVSTLTSSVVNCDPWLSPDLSLLPSIGLCFHGGAVMHANETFALTWDPKRLSSAGTRDYVEQFLKDVADGSGTLTSPYAVSSQYADGSSLAGSAQDNSKYGGGCIDYGSPGGYTCQFANTTGIGVGSNYPANGCTPSAANQVCLTDTQIQTEVTTHVQRADMLGHLMPGYTPLLVVLMPQHAEICVDSGGTLCSVNGASTAQFCSYHSQIAMPDGRKVAYVVQPWSANTACDEPNLPALPANPTAVQIATDAGVRIVNPLSQGQLAAIVNPGLNGWFAEDGSEINDNYGCMPEGYPFDAVTVGTSSQNAYYLAREFNNAGVIDTDPGVPACALGVALAPTFVVPSAVEPGDLVQFDGSVTNSTLIVPKAGYIWSYGDGTTAVGPSVEHSYAQGGTYSVKLSVTDRGGNSASVTKTVTVLGPTGQVVSPPHPGPGLHVRLQLMPQGLRAMLRKGVALRVSSNEPADGIATLSISRNVARRAHIRTGRGAIVVIGRGTVSGIKDGTVLLHVRMSRDTAAKLGRLGHLTLTVRLALVAAAGDHLAIDAAGRY